MNLPEIPTLSELSSHLQRELGWTDDYAWSRLGGGRSNMIWKVVGPDKKTYVAKLYSPSRGNALFPNDAGQEVLALKALAGTGLAPTLVDTVQMGGAMAVVYDFLNGQIGPGTPEAAGKVLSRLHRMPVPRGLREIAPGTRGIRQLAKRFSDDIPNRAFPPRPTGDMDAPIGGVFLHGDPVPANMVREQSQVALIDWQCPAVGDPCEDIAVFLSPAMQSLYGGRPLNRVETDQFFDAYGAPDVRDRYRDLAPLFHWRMGVYCLWMDGQGATDYGSVAKLEFEALEKVED